MPAPRSLLKIEKASEKVFKVTFWVNFFLLEMPKFLHVILNLIKKNTALSFLYRQKKQEVSGILPTGLNKSLEFVL